VSRAARDGLIVAVGGQVERLLGTFTALALRWGLDPARLGVYTGLRLYLDNTNRTSLGVGLGAVQEVPILRAQGREVEAQRILNIAHTTNTLTCLLYAIVLAGIAVWWAVTKTADPLAAEWAWGLMAIAGLTLLKRHESFLIAALRAHGEFVLTTELDILESCVSAVAVGIGLWFFGFWGLLAAVGVILVAKITYLRIRHPLRFHFAWHLPTVTRLMVVGLPILANTAAFGAVLSLDRIILLSLVPDGARAAGLYTVALMGTSWSLDVAGRIVLVLYTHFQTTLGRTGDVAEVAKDSLRATEAQAPILAAGGAIAYVFAPWFLGMLMPKYLEGTEAIRPLMPGMVLLGLAWPARQMLIAIGRPYRLFLATLVSLAFAAEVGAIGAAKSGLIGVAWAMSCGYTAVFLLTELCGFATILGFSAWCGHLGRLARVLVPLIIAAGIAAHFPIAQHKSLEMLMRGLMLAALAGPFLIVIGLRAGWLDVLHQKQASKRLVIAARGA
jgi:O-antigen/teichoic acid export membrane protein